MEVYYGNPGKTCLRNCSQNHTISAVFANEDYEQYAIDRDNEINEILQAQGGEIKLFKDQVIFAKKEVVKKNGEPYTVFTPYSKLWLKTLKPFYVKSYPTEKYFDHFYKQPPFKNPSLQSMGFEATGEPFPSKEFNEAIISDMTKPAIFLRFRAPHVWAFTCVLAPSAYANWCGLPKKENDVFLKELIWRDFYQMILWQSDDVKKEKAFKPKFDTIQWRNNEDEFALWCEGKTGYPIVDAGMRQLNAMGYMHNRVRMITASFLSKHLLIDWRWGEAYFAKKLLDYDYAANNGGWQWSAGTGADPSPYFRVFNPESQAKKFDKQLTYIRHWVPE